MLASLLANILLLYEQEQSLNTNRTIKQNVEQLETQLANLRQQNLDHQNQLNAKLNQTQPPKLVTRLGSNDVRSSPYQNHPSSGQTRLYIEGEVWNVGQTPAKNSNLHVILYRQQTIVNDTHIQLGTIEPGSYVDIAVNINYAGDALTNRIITPEYG